MTVLHWTKRTFLGLAAAFALAASPLVMPAVAQDAAPLVIASSEDVTSLDPHLLDSNHPTGSVIWSIFDSLVRRGYDGEPVPRLAESWERVSDVTWRFHLRKGVKFHNGEDFNAEAVRINFERMSKPPYNAVQQLHEQTGLSEVKIVDEYTIELTTKQPTINMHYWLAEAFIGAPKYLSETNPDEVGVKPIGSGPYKFVEWRKGDRVILTANENYWNGAPPIKDVVFRAVPEVSSRVNELIAGSVDIAVGLTPDSADQAKSDVSGVTVVEGLRKMHMGISIKGEQPALQDPRVRRALNHAVDVQTIIKTLMRGSTSALVSIVNPPNNNPDLKPLPYDPELAKKLLAEAGFADGFPLTIQWSTRFSGGKEVSETVGAYLQQVGIKPAYEAVELGQFRTMLGKASLKGIYFQGWAALINPSVELVILTCGHVDNSSGYCNPEYDKLVKEAATSLDDAKRKPLEYAAQKIIWEDAPWLYLWKLPNYYGVANRVDYKFRADNYLEPYLAKLK